MEGQKPSSPLLGHSASSSLESLLLELATTAYGPCPATDTMNLSRGSVPTEQSASPETLLVPTLQIHNLPETSEQHTLMTEDESITALLLSTLKLVAESPLPSVSTADPDPGFSSTSSSGTSTNSCDPDTAVVIPPFFPNQTFATTLQDAYWNDTLYTLGSLRNGEPESIRNIQDQDLHHLSSSLYHSYKGIFSQTSPPGCSAAASLESSIWDCQRADNCCDYLNQRGWLSNYTLHVDALASAASIQQHHSTSDKNYNQDILLYDDARGQREREATTVNPPGPLYGKDTRKLGHTVYESLQTPSGVKDDASMIIPQYDESHFQAESSVAQQKQALEQQQQLQQKHDQQKSQQKQQRHQYLELKLNRPGNGPTYWGMWEDERSRMVYVSWLPRAARAGDRAEKKRCEVELKYFISRVLGFSGLLKVLLFPPSSAHCKLLFASETAARRFLETFGTMQSENGAALWKSLVCEHFRVNIRDGIHATRVKIIWADQTKTDSEILAKAISVQDKSVYRKSGDLSASFQQEHRVV